jgi:hypothetical protein
MTPPLVLSWLKCVKMPAMMFWKKAIGSAYARDLTE